MHSFILRTPALYKKVYPIISTRSAAAASPVSAVQLSARSAIGFSTRT